MAKRQKFQGILQFKNQGALEQAMEVVIREAPEAEAYGLQDCYFSPGLMKMNIDVIAQEAKWEEVKEAVAILAESAVRGYVFAGLQGQDSQLFEAAADFENQYPAESSGYSVNKDQYFPFKGGAKYVWKGKSGNISRQIEQLNIAGDQYFKLVENGKPLIGGLEEGVCFSKEGGLVFRLKAGDNAGIAALKKVGGRYDYQLNYREGSKQNDINAVFDLPQKTTRIFATEGFQDLNLPGGNFTNCLRIRLDNCFIGQAEYRERTYYQYFAKGIGLVKVDAPEGILELLEYS